MIGVGWVSFAVGLLWVCFGFLVAFECGLDLWFWVVWVVGLSVLVCLALGVFCGCLWIGCWCLRVRWWVDCWICFGFWLMLLALLDFDCGGHL